ncbi:MAG: tetratricopeptide repeat protein [Myxococcota bacterium]
MGNYTLRDVARITGVSRARLRYWERTSLLASGGELRADAAVLERSDFEFGDLVAVRSVLSLLDRGVSLRRIRKSIAALRENIPEVQRPLGSLRPWTDGSARVVVCCDGGLVEPNGQFVLDFSGDRLRTPVTLRSEAEAAESQQSAMDWFEQGCKLDSNRATYAEAIEAYQTALECDPTFADAHCNLGSVYYNQDRLTSARTCFERAVAYEPLHVEANLNLATLFEEESRYQMALRHYRVALRADPLTADIQVSLALLYEKIGLRRKARAYWKRYLQLEPNGTWVETARQRLDS